MVVKVSVVSVSSCGCVMSACICGGACHCAVSVIVCRIVVCVGGGSGGVGSTSVCVSVARFIRTR